MRRWLGRAASVWGWCALGAQKVSREHVGSCRDEPRTSVAGPGGLGVEMVRAWGAGSFTGAICSCRDEDGARLGRGMLDCGMPETALGVRFVGRFAQRKTLTFDFVVEVAR